MKKAIYAVFISSICLFCKKDECKNQKKGIILGKISPKCVLTLPRSGVVITNDSIYGALFEPQDSLACNLPLIDFNQHTLLGKTASAGGSKAYFQHKVTRDDINKRYIYTIYSCDKGLEKILLVNNSLVKVPKLPNGYEVEFIEK